MSQGMVWYVHTGTNHECWTHYTLSLNLISLLIPNALFAAYLSTSTVHTCIVHVQYIRVHMFTHIQIQEGASLKISFIHTRTQPNPSPKYRRGKSGA